MFTHICLLPDLTPCQRSFECGFMFFLKFGRLFLEIGVQITAQRLEWENISRRNYDVLPFYFKSEHIRNGTVQYVLVQK